MPAVANAIGIRIAVKDDNFNAFFFLRLAKVSQRKASHKTALETEAPRRIPIKQGLFLRDRPT